MAKIHQSLKSNSKSMLWDLCFLIFEFGFSNWILDFRFWSLWEIAWILRFKICCKTMPTWVSGLSELIGCQVHICIDQAALGMRTRKEKH